VGHVSADQPEFPFDAVEPQPGFVGDGGQRVAVEPFGFIGQDVFPGGLEQAGAVVGEGVGTADIAVFGGLFVGEAAGVEEGRER
jgi:hypothetical protein